MTSQGIDFSGFSDPHFDAYEPAKWASNRFNLERMKVREQAEALVRQALAVLEDGGPALGVTATQDHPTIFNKKRCDAQWVLVGRDESLRRRIEPLLHRERTMAAALEDPTPEHQEAFLCVRVGLEGAEVALRLHRHAHLDRRNLATRLATPESRSTLLELLRALPSDARVAFDGSPGRAAAELSEQDLVTLDGAADWWSVGQAFARIDLTAAGADFAATATRLLHALGPVYRFIAWTPENDHVEGMAFLQGEEKKAETRHKEPVVPAATLPPRKERPAPVLPGVTLTGWSYRPEWQAPAQAKPEPEPRGASARTRERAAEAAAGMGAWAYSGPVRAPPPPPEPPPAPEPPAPRPREERPRFDGPPQQRRDGPPQQRRDGPPQQRRDGPPQQRRDGPPRDRPRDDRPRDARPRDDRRSDRRDERRDQAPQSRPEPKKAPTWTDAEGDIRALDMIRIRGGLLDGKVGKVTDVTSKGNFKVALGDMAFEVPRASATKVVPAE